MVFRILLPACIGLGLAIGCSSSKGPKLASADGTVNYMGKPLAGATVIFLPDKGPLAMGVTDAKGKFQLSTGTSRGVVVGHVQVTVVAAAPGKIESDVISKRPQTPAETEAYMKKAAEMQQAMASGNTEVVQPKSLIPAKYGKAETSGVSYTIKANGDNHFTIELQ